MDYNKIYINSSNIIDNLESMYYKTDNIKLKNKILYEINKYKKLNEICLIKNPNIKENIIHKLSNDFLFIIKLNFINDENIVKNDADSDICEHCAHKTKERSEKEHRDMISRLNRIEGQIRGIKGMVERDAYCTDILVQVAAVNAALNSFNRVLLANHIKTCVTQDIRDGREETVDELVDILQKLMK